MMDVVKVSLHNTVLDGPWMTMWIISEDHRSPFMAPWFHGRASGGELTVVPPCLNQCILRPHTAKIINIAFGLQHPTHPTSHIPHGHPLCLFFQSTIARPQRYYLGLRERNLPQKPNAKAKGKGKSNSSRSPSLSFDGLSSVLLFPVFFVLHHPLLF